jgi:RimJ/RimL family protein N-acetyltransferase
MKNVEISNGELLLRRAKMSEARFLAQAVRSSLKELAPFLPWATPAYDLDAARAFLEYAYKEEKEHRGFHISIFLERSGELIGGVGLMLKAIPDHAEIGYWIRSDQAGKGYASQASFLIMEHGFRALELRRIYLTCDVANRASRRVAEKLGMRKEGRLKDYLECLGRATDHFLYAILRDEFMR